MCAMKAQNRPIQLPLIAPAEIYPESNSDSGVRLSLQYRRNVNVTGFDLFPVSQTTAGISKGVQFGGVALVDANFVGWHNAPVNIVSYSNDAEGVQFGLVSYARKLKGLQIGLVNVIRQGGEFPVFPIVNWSF